jgi:hypothetical protein
LSGSKQVAFVEVIRDYEMGFGPKQEEQFLYIQLLASTNIPPTTKRLNGSKPVSELAATLSPEGIVLAELFEAGYRTVVVHIGAGSVRPRHAKGLTHSLTSSQFFLAQFYHPEIMSGYVAIFVSTDRKDAKVAAENQKKYHPKQMVGRHEHTLYVLAFGTYCFC